MNKNLILTILLVLSVFAAQANHISGGEMIYEYLGPGNSPNTKLYRITLKLFRDNTGGGAAMPNNVLIGIYNNSTLAALPGSPFNVNLTSTSIVPVETPPSCMTNPPVINYNVGIYSFTVELPNTPNGYTAAYQTCCRIFPLENVFTQNQPSQGHMHTKVTCCFPNRIFRWPFCGRI